VGVGVFTVRVVEASVTPLDFTAMTAVAEGAVTVLLNDPEVVARNDDDDDPMNSVRR
jgi:hypothetical protein